MMKTFFNFRCLIMKQTNTELTKCLPTTLYSTHAKVLFCFLCLFYFFSLTQNFINFYFAFPNSYMWGEVFISYAAGFIRRGLQGTIWLWFGQHNFDVQRIIAVFYYTLMLAATAFCIHFVFTKFDLDIAYFIVLSPGIFVCRLTNYGKFARIENIFIVLLVLLVYLILYANLRSKFTHISIYFISGFGILLNEFLIFFLPICWLLLYVRAKDQKLNLFSLTCKYILSFSMLLIVIYSFSGTAEQQTIIEEQLSTLFPNYVKTQFNGIWWIDKTLRDNIPFFFYTEPRMWFISNDFFWFSPAPYSLVLYFVTIFIGYVLTFLPLLWVMKRYDLLKFLNQTFNTKFEKLFCILSFFSPFLLIALSLDAGRFISLHAVFCVFFLYGYTKIKGINIKAQSVVINKQLVNWLCLYVVGWSMSHCNASTGIIIHPTFFFDAL